MEGFSTTTLVTKPIFTFPTRETILNTTTAVTTTVAKSCIYVCFVYLTKNVFKILRQRFRFS